MGASIAALIHSVDITKKRKKLNCQVPHPRWHLLKDFNVKWLHGWFFAYSLHQHNKYYYCLIYKSEVAKVISFKSLAKNYEKGKKMTFLSCFQYLLKTKCDKIDKLNLNILKSQVAWLRLTHACLLVHAMFPGNNISAWETVRAVNHCLNFFFS